MNFFTHIFKGFYLDFNLLFIVFFLRNHFGRLFHVSVGAVCFSDRGGGASFISGEGGGVAHREQHWFWGWEFKKNRKISGTPAPSMPPTPLWETLCVDIELLLCMLSSVLCMFSACMFYFTNITNV